MRINNISFSSCQQANKMPKIKQSQDVCTFSGKPLDFDDLTPTPEEIRGVIDHLPQDAQEAEKHAKADVKALVSEVRDLIRKGEIRSPQDYREYMEDYVVLGKKVFEKMTPEQKLLSIMFQEKTIEEMNNLKPLARTSSMASVFLPLIEEQIKMSSELLQHCKKSVVMV